MTAIPTPSDRPAGFAAIGLSGDTVEVLPSASTRTRSCCRWRAAYTRSGRVATTALSTAAVMTASPIPTRMCQPTIAVASLPSGMSTAPPIAYSPVNASAATGTDTSAPTRRRRYDAARPAAAAPAAPRGSATYPTSTVIRPISVMFVPSAVSPPSANSSPWTRSTVDITSTAVHGPTSAAASAPPSRWPLVPAPTGKFTICTANTKAAVSPASAGPVSRISRFARCRLNPTAPAAIRPVATDVGASKKPSGTCTATFLI